MATRFTSAISKTCLSLLKSSANRLPVCLLETIGVYVSLLNGCDYCVDHHFAGLRRLVGDARADAIRAALDNCAFADAFDARETCALKYAAALTERPWTVTQAMVDGMREAGYDDGEVLEINQVSAYFAYANRTTLGLGTTTEDDVLGLSPGDSDDPGNWSHT